MPQEMSEAETFVLNYLRGQYSEHNQFYNLLGINIEKAFKGHAIQSMFADPAKHSNLYANLHGGVFMTIGDSCMGVACASLGKRVVTLDTHTNFIANINLPAKITCEADVVHNGHHTILMCAKTFDENRQLLSKMRSTYYVVGVFEEVASKLI